MLRHVSRRTISAIIARPSLIPASSHSVNIITSSKALYSSSTTAHFPSTGKNKCPLGHSTMTKIVCTLGPSSDTEGPISALVSYGMHVARLNFSHAGNDYTYPSTLLQLVRSSAGMHSDLSAGASSESDLPPNLRAILVDTKGPEIRTGPLQGNVDVLELEAGSVVELTNADVSSETPPSAKDSEDDRTDTVHHRLQVDYQSMAQTLTVGNSVLLDDGLIELEVTHVDEASKTVQCIVLNSGPIRKNKGVNLPNVPLDLPALTEKDKQDLRWACEVGADYVAASFIRTPANVRSVVAYLNRCIANIAADRATSAGAGGKAEEEDDAPLRPLVISKIESKEGVDNFDGILAESDGIMVARGDLGVEIPYSDVFAAQKMMVRECNAAGKPVIVATQMLDSMRVNPRPTRAEVTDVGTAVLDGADAIMLSGETAAGKYPLQSLKAMTAVATEADRIYDSNRKILSDEDGQLGLRRKDMSCLDAELDSVAESAVRSARDMNAQMIILITKSGLVARAVARHRPTVPVLAFCTNPQVARRLQLHRSLTPVMLQTKYNPYDPMARMGLMRAEAIRTAKELGFLRPGDRYVTVDRTKGKPHDMHVYSHNMKVATLRET